MGDWNRITEKQTDYIDRLNRLLCRVHASHKLRYYKHSIESLKRFMKPGPKFDCLVKGQIKTLTIPRAFTYENEVAKKELSAVFWLRPGPTDVPAAYVLTLAGKKFQADMAIADPVARATAQLDEMLAAANALCIQFNLDRTNDPIENPELLPIELICAEGDAQQNSPYFTPSTDPDIADLWKYACDQTPHFGQGTAGGESDADSFIHRKPNIPSAPPYPPNITLYRWILVPH